MAGRTQSGQTGFRLIGVDLDRLALGGLETIESG